MGNRDNGGRFASRDTVQHVKVRPRVDGAKEAGEQCIAREPSRQEQLETELKAEQQHRMLQDSGERFLRTIDPVYSATQNQLSEELYAWFKHQGFWPKDWSPYSARYAQQGDTEHNITIPFSEYVRLKKMEKLGLIVTEVAECMEAVRKDDLENEVEELADIDVRMHDYKGGFGHISRPFENGGATEGFIWKMLKNFQRPFRHGKQF